MNYDFKGVFLMLLIAAGIVGWAIIQGIIWLFNHINISWS